MQADDQLTAALVSGDDQHAGQLCNMSKLTGIGSVKHIKSAFNMDATFRIKKSDLLAVPLDDTGMTVIH